MFSRASVRARISDRRALLKISAVMDGKPRRARAPRPKTAHVAESPEPPPATVSPKRAVRYDPDEPFGGKWPLSVIQQDVMHYMAEGVSNSEIAKRLGRSPRTVETHVTNIFGKLLVSDRNAAVARYHEWDTARLKHRIIELQGQVRAKEEQIAALRRQLRKQP